MRFCFILALVPTLAGCATPRATQNAQSPTAAEVSRYVSLHWPDVRKTFGRLANRPGQTAELIETSLVSCGYTYTTPECSYQVTGRFGNEPNVQQRLFSQFERDGAGNLVEVVVMWHERRP